MKNILLLLVLTTAIVFNSSCGKEDPCDLEVIEVKSLEDEYGCINTKYTMHIFITAQFTVISSQSSFESLISGDCTPENIDFSTYDLIVGKQGLTSGNTSIEYEMMKDCDPIKYSLKVIFNQNATTEAPNLTYHALVPKLEEDSVLEVTIEEKF